MSDSDPVDFKGLACPIPLSEYPTVQLAHGGGGKHDAAADSTSSVRPDTFDNAALARLQRRRRRSASRGAGIAFTTDSFVVRPLFFPGGNIGSLAVHGTLNDLAMCGATPARASPPASSSRKGSRWRTCGASSRRCRATPRSAEVAVVDRRHEGGRPRQGRRPVYINTTGVGLVPDRRCEIDPRCARGRAIAVLLSGRDRHPRRSRSSPCARAWSSKRRCETDSAWHSGPLVDAPARGRRRARPRPARSDARRGREHDSTRSRRAGRSVGIRHRGGHRCRCGDDVRGACEILGLDPLYVANEGKCLAIVAPDHADAALEAMRSHPLGSAAAIVGEVVEDHPGRVYLRSRLGSQRLVDMLSGEQLPRIC